MNISDLYNIYLFHPNVITDSREVVRDSMFFALKGESFNGNEFAETALKNGCSYAVIDEKKYQKDMRYILVDNVLETLQELAKHHRKLLNIPVIGITGTNGKTTTKELIKAVLSKKYHVLATSGNLNNHIGVPLTILSIIKDVEIAIIEMGANHIGEIAELCEISQPYYGIITNIGKAHLEGFGNIDGIIKTKRALYDYLNNHSGVAFVNSDNDLLKTISEGIPQITYGTSSSADYKGKLTAMNPFIKMEWDSGNASVFRNAVQTKMIGSYNFENILAAICIGNFFNVAADDINSALADYESSNNRSQILKTDKNTVILDAYNANPTSMRAAIENFTTLDFAEKVVIVGDMLELGEESKAEHQHILDLLKKQHYNKVYLVGKMFTSLAGDVPSFVCFEDVHKAHEYFTKTPLKNTSVMIKASRGIRLETLIDLF